ncbi:hypothetical protein PILCRDRAFT_828487 [Piloderma croceum F 1598]|uniref:Uncharacterized protein n=1 Tax=Piloderma croceum (strain F 1598) TaxID=765440 RepID=A0A0C3BA40_PILCF|nr:hypothetical protein PILCRDRAFT_828487 [Piloderma croceum F 1598]
MSEWAYQGQCTPLRIRRMVCLHFGLGCEIEDASVSESVGVTKTDGDLQHTFVLPGLTEFRYTLSIWDLRSALLLEAC